jgi:hypothetical protein
MKYFSEDHKEIESGKKLDDEGYMAMIEMDKIDQSLQKLRKVVKSSKHQLPAWVQSKITKASDYLDVATDYLAADVEMDESLSFVLDKSKHKKTQKNQKILSRTNPKKNPQAEVDNAETILKKRGVVLSPPTMKEETSLVDKIISEIIGDKPGWNIKKSKNIEDIAKKHKISLNILEKQLKQGMKIEMEHTTDKGEAEIIALQHLDERPDYYDRLIKMEKQPVVKEAKKYMTKKEDPCWKGYKMVGSKKKGGKEVPNCVPVEEATIRLPMQTGQLLRVLVNWRGKYLSVQLFFAQLRPPKREEIVYAVNKIYPDSRVISYTSCEVDSDTPIVQVKEDISIVEDWQKVNKKDRTDGMSSQAVKAYRRENPGSKLKTAVTEKNPTGKRAGRRVNYCSRSKGQQDMHNIDCSATPDKPICKARRRWNC